MVPHGGMGTHATLPDNQPSTALVVDDNEGIRTFMVHALEYNHWCAVAVESGRLALDELKDRRFDVIFLDLNMPNMNGAEVLRAIRRETPEAKVVIITGDPGSSIYEEALRSEPFAVMKKPIALDEIRKILMYVSKE